MLKRKYSYETRSARSLPKDEKLKNILGLKNKNLTLKNLELDH